MAKIEIKGYKYNQADFNGMDYKEFTEKFSETFKDCDLENCYKLLTGHNPNPVIKSVEDGETKRPVKKTGKV